MISETTEAAIIDRSANIAIAYLLKFYDYSRESLEFMDPIDLIVLAETLWEKNHRSSCGYRCPR